MDMKQIDFDSPVLTNLKHLKMVGPRMAGTRVVSDARIGYIEGAPIKLYNQKSKHKIFLVMHFWFATLAAIIALIYCILQLR